MTTTNNALAQVYAKSVFALSEEAGGRAKIEEIADELEQIVELMRQDAQFAQFLGSPIIDVTRRAAALRRLFEGQVTDITLRFLSVLNRRRRLAALTEIADAFGQLVHESFGRVEVDVFTAVTIESEQLDGLKQRIQEAIGKEPVLHLYTDPTLIGGLKLKIGDQMIDGSVKSRVRRMRQRLLTSGGWSLRDRMSKLIDEA